MGLGCLRTRAMAPAHPHFPLRGWMVIRYRGGIGPLKPAPAHPHFPLRGWMVVRYRGGIREREGERERAEGAWIKIKMKFKLKRGYRLQATGW